MRDEFPVGVQAGKFETLVQQAVRDGLAYGQARMRERADADVWGDGVTTRIPLTGRDLRLLDLNDWVTPTGLNTAGIAAPTTAPTYTAGAGGTLPAGIYHACFAYETPLGVTTPTAPVATTVAASGKVVRGAITPATGATIADYLSIRAGSGEMRRVATGGTGIALDLTAVPAATAAVAQIDYTDLSTLDPVMTLEPGIAPDGSVSATVSTLTLGTAIPAAARVRVSFTRTPLYPALSTTQIGLDDDFLRLATKAHVCRALTLNPRNGDATPWAAMEKELFAQLDMLLGTASGRRGMRVKYVRWS